MNKVQCLLTLLAFSALIATTVFLKKEYDTDKSSNAIALTSQQHRRSLTEWFRKIDPKTVQTKTKKSDGFLRAFKASHGFFYDIPNGEWGKAISIAQERSENQHRPDANQRSNPRQFYQENWEPNFSCRFEQRVGIMGDGGKWVCDPHRIKALSSIRETEDGKADPCLVYSIGSDGDFSFEHGVMDVLGEDECEIHTFEMKGMAQLKFKDETDEQKRKTAKVNQHYGWGLQSSEQGARPGYYNLFQTIKALGHEGRTIDIFKIDCEGCEWSTFQDWIDAPALLHQVLVEVHMNPATSNNMFDAMQKAGYVIFHKEPNIQYGGGACVEYAFLKLNREFQESDHY